MVRALLLSNLTLLSSFIILSGFAGLSSFAMAATYPLEKIATPFVGSRLYTAATVDLKTSIVILHGSEGGSNFNGDPQAMMLAMLGYRVLRFCYFDCGRGITGPRQTLRNVNAEDVLTAVEWLRELPGGNGKVVVYGISRGAELAMIVGSLTYTSANRPNALIAHAPSDLFAGPFNWDWAEVACWLCRAGTACAVEDDFDWNPRCGPDDPRQVDWGVAAFKVGGKSIAAGTRIEIEKYEGPILITVVEKDEIWPASQTHNIDKTLRAAGRTPEIHYFPEGGHGLHGADEIRRVNLLLDFLERVPRRR